MITPQADIEPPPYTESALQSDLDVGKAHTSHLNLWILTDTGMLVYLIVVAQILSLETDRCAPLSLFERICDEGFSKVGERSVTL